MFDPVSKVAIEVVNFTNVNLTKINGSMFAALKSLKVLDLRNNPQLKQITEDISLALQQTSIQELYLAKTCLGRTGSVANVIENLMRTKVTVLTLDWNQIHNMGQTHIFDRLPYLEILTATHNNLRDYEGFLYNFTNADHLKILDISHQNTWVPKTPCGIQNQNQQVSSEKELVNKPRHFKFQRKSESSNNFFFPIWRPNNLEWLSLSYNELRIYPFPAIDFMRNGSIKHIDVSDNIFKTVPNPFYCYHTISMMEHVDISNCQIADPGGGPRGPWPPPGPVKIGHKKDGRQRQPHRFHVSRPPPYPAIGSAIGSCTVLLKNSLQNVNGYLSLQMSVTITLGYFKEDAMKTQVPEIFLYYLSH